MSKYRIFLAAPFQSKIHPEKRVMEPEDSHRLSKIINFLADKGHSVHNAHIREKWGEAWMESDMCTKIDYEEIKNSDLLIAFPGNPISGGVHVELGWASALGKKIIILLDEKEEFSNLIHGLGQVSDVSYIRYSTEEELYERLSKLI